MVKLRRGRKRAITAVAHGLLVIAYAMLPGRIVIPYIGCYHPISCIESGG